MVSVTSISKRFGGVQALLEVSLELAPGEIHALCGENGAGKSTLIKCLAGVVVPDAGTVTVDGEPIAPGRVRASEVAGIAVIHQESTVFPDLTAVENVFVGRELKRGRLFLDHGAMRTRTREILDRLGVSLDLGVAVDELSLAQRQMVAIARALSMDCRTLILDEPTASLSARESEALLSIVERLRESGLSILYVSHRLDEVFRLANRVTVLRDGALVKTLSVQDTSIDEIIRLMVGREVQELTQRHEHAPAGDTVVLSVRGLCSPATFHDISFDVRAGEILGLGGLVGAGRSEVACALFGVAPYASGAVTVDGAALPGGRVEAAIAAGIALIPEDRQAEGLVLPMQVSENISLVVLRRLARLGFVRRAAERRLVDEQMQRLQVKASSPSVPANTLSGGNQQKLVIGKWLAARPRVLILDEPTRGVDVGAKAEVHRLVRQLASEGSAILLISSEMPELLTLSDRIVVMREGRISGEVPGETATDEAILRLALPDAEEVALA